MTRWTVERRSTASGSTLADDVREGLQRDPVTFPPKWFYDEKGSQLFDAITELPEYYPTRAEQALLEQSVHRLPLADVLIELGAGYSRKTRLLLERLTDGGRALLFVPVDVAGAPLVDAAQRITADFPTVTVSALVADFGASLAPLPGEPGRRIVAFLGSTIGNLDVDERAAFLDRLRAATDPGDLFLLGADLVKDVDRLERAYDDAAGVTAAFNKNLLEVLARELQADVDPDDFDHVARWDAEHERIEMRLRARRDLEIALPPLDLVWRLRAGEEVLTETSAKFRVPALQQELTGHGFAPVDVWTGDAQDFALLLSRRV